MTFQYITATGTIIPDTVDIRLGVITDFQAVFGNALNTSPETPQGVFINLFTAERDALARNNADVANQINPNLAGGIWLDAICALTGLKRKAAQATLVTAVLLGQNGVTVPAGSRVKTYAGDVFASVKAVTISDGVAVVQFKAQQTGAVPCDANQLETIIDQTLGWTNVSNPESGAVGFAMQSDPSLRALRRRTLALQGKSTPEAIQSAIWAMPDVRSMLFRENIDSDPQEIDGVLIDGHSVYVVVDGGTDDEIAAMLLQKKSEGANWTGELTVPTTEPTSGQVYPVKFTRAHSVDIQIRVTIAKNYPGNGERDVIASILNWAAGNQPENEGFITGANVSPFEIAGALNIDYPVMFVRKVEVCKAGTGQFATDEIEINIWEVARTSSGLIQVLLV